MTNYKLEGTAYATEAATKWPKRMVNIFVIALATK